MGSTVPPLTPGPSKGHYPDCPTRKDGACPCVEGVNAPVWPSRTPCNAVVAGQRCGQPAPCPDHHQSPSVPCNGHVPACHHGTGPIACDACIQARKERGRLYCDDLEACAGPGCMDGIYDPSEQRWVCIACDMEHPPGPCPLDVLEDPDA